MSQDKSDSISGLIAQSRALQTRYRGFEHKDRYILEALMMHTHLELSKQTLQCYCEDQFVSVLSILTLAFEFTRTRGTWKRDGVALDNLGRVYWFQQARLILHKVEVRQGDGDTLNYIDAVPLHTH